MNHLFNIRLEGSSSSVEGVTAEEILEGVKEGIWDPSDEIMGPGEREWTPIEKHYVFAQAMEDYEPPPPPAPEDETRLDMNPLIDVALVLLIFFMLTTTYEELRKEFNIPPAERQNQKGRMTEQQLKSTTVRVKVSMEGDNAVFRVEDEVVAERDLEAKFKEYIDSLGHDKLAMEADGQVPWRAVMAIQDAAAGAKFQQIIRVTRAPKE